MHSPHLVLFTALCGIVLHTGCGPIAKVVNVAALKGSGVIVSESRETEAFHAVGLSDAITGVITVGETHTIELSGDDNIVPLVRTEVRNGVLKIDINHDGGFKPTRPLTATISTPDLNSVELNGTSSADITGVESDTLNLDLDGASRMKIACDSKSIVIDIDGVSHLDISGQCEQLKADLDGTSKLNAIELLAENVNIDVDGVSKATVYASNELTADVDGVSSIKYAGNPTKVNSDKDGVSSITALE